ncbi:hypothetical protein [Fodinibius salsisoli]|uniref:Peptidase MA superfamily protein n=1 Tax=Fodinibius salsisoli TaxID=2820877 RepID=A0ABT3PR31_9BACT|nr:hypothetical protein [Fodinibius salsisoli]MCW9708319.1 hypothetical protein [Fodinibius salsisoli]
MKKICISILLTIFCFLNGNAQELIDLPIAPRVDTTDAEVQAVFKLWQKHLSNHPDQIYDNPYWSEQQKEKWHDYDISRRWTYGYELANGMNLHDAFGLKPRVLSIEKRDSVYAIKTLYAPSNLKNSQEIYSIQRVFAGRENGEWKLFSVLPILTEKWKRKQVGDIQYIYPPNHKFDKNEAQDSANFVKELANKFEITLSEPINYYLAQNFVEMAKISGLNYAWDGNDGRGYPKNNQVFVGTGSESYPHELVHTIFKDYELDPFVDEGLATYYGDIGQKSFDQLVQSIAQKITSNKSLTLSKVLTGQRISSKIYYVSGAVLIKAAEEKGGPEAVKKFLKKASSEEGIHQAMNQVLGVSKDEANSFWRQKVQEYGT